MELGLFLVWANGGQELESLTEKIDHARFAERLNLLEKFTVSKYPVGASADTYAGWLRDAHAIRGLRYQLVHGRWGFIPLQGLVANVVGLPTSPNQLAIHYSIEQLNGKLQSLKLLRSRLHKLRKQAPI